MDSSSPLTRDSSSSLSLIVASQPCTRTVSLFVPAIVSALLFLYPIAVVVVLAGTSDSLETQGTSPETTTTTILASSSNSVVASSSIVHDDTSSPPIVPSYHHKRMPTLRATRRRQPPSETARAEGTKVPTETTGSPSSKNILRERAKATEDPCPEQAIEHTVRAQNADSSSTVQQSRDDHPSRKPSVTRQSMYSSRRRTGQGSTARLQTNDRANGEPHCPVGQVPRWMVTTGLQGSMIERAWSAHQSSLGDNDQGSIKTLHNALKGQEEGMTEEGNRLSMMSPSGGNDLDGIGISSPQFDETKSRPSDSDTTSTVPNSEDDVQGNDHVDSDQTSPSRIHHGVAVDRSKVMDPQDMPDKDGESYSSIPRATDQFPSVERGPQPTKTRSLNLENVPLGHPSNRRMLRSLAIHTREASSENDREGSKDVPCSERSNTMTPASKIDVTHKMELSSFSNVQAAKEQEARKTGKRSKDKDDTDDNFNSRPSEKSTLSDENQHNHSSQQWYCVPVTAPPKQSLSWSIPPTANKEDLPNVSWMDHSTGENGVAPSPIAAMDSHPLAWTLQEIPSVPIPKVVSISKDQPSIKEPKMALPAASTPTPAPLVTPSSWHVPSAEPSTRLLPTAKVLLSTNTFSDTATSVHSETSPNAATKEPMVQITPSRAPSTKFPEQEGHTSPSLQPLVVSTSQDTEPLGHKVWNDRNSFSPSHPTLGHASTPRTVPPPTMPYPSPRQSITAPPTGVYANEQPTAWNRADTAVSSLPSASLEFIQEVVEITPRHLGDLPSSSDSNPASPTSFPTEGPTVLPTEGPTVLPTEGPSVLPAEGPTVLPTEGPTVLPTEGPSVLPTEGPTVLPTEGPSVLPTEGPSVLPTEGPTVLPTEGSTNRPEDGEEEDEQVRQLENTDFSITVVESRSNFTESDGNSIHCDFRWLERGIALSNVDQADILEQACFLKMSGTKQNNSGTREVTVIDTGNVTKSNQWQLGPPHGSCGGQDKVNGVGGRVGGLFPNCPAQGTALVLQRHDIVGVEGCINFDFVDPVDLKGMGILNVPDEGTITISITDADGDDCIITSPKEAGRNSLWFVNATDSNFQRKSAVLMSVCSPTVFAISFLDFVHRGRGVEEELVPVFAESDEAPSEKVAAPLSEANGTAALPSAATNASSKQWVEADSVIFNEAMEVLTEEDIYSVSEVETWADTPTKFVHCDFAGLVEGVGLSDVDQRDILEHSCAFAVTGTNADTTGSRSVNVLDSSNISRRDGVWDLGSLHSSCGGPAKVPGINGTFSNCMSQGNILYVEEENMSSMKGGCMNIDFVDPVQITGIGVLNMPNEGTVRVTTIDADGVDGVVICPGSVRLNSFWVVNETHPDVDSRHVVFVSICSHVAVGLAFVDYYRTDHRPKSAATEALLSQSVTPDEPLSNFSRCNGHITGFSLVEISARGDIGTALPGYESLFNGQRVIPSELPEHVAVVALTGSVVETVQFIGIGQNVSVASRPFLQRMAGDWLGSAQVSVKIQANAYAQNKTKVGSCEVELEVESPPVPSSEVVDCGPGVTGFLLLDRDGNIIPGYDHLKNRQVISGEGLPQGVDVAVHYGELLGAVKYETDILDDVYETDYPFRVNVNNFHVPGKYHLKAHGYGDQDFLSKLNSCEIYFEVR